MNSFRQKLKEIKKYVNKDFMRIKSDSNEITATPEQQEKITDPKSNLPYLFAAFAITWAIFFVYIYVLSTRQRYLQHEVETLRKVLTDKNTAK